MINALLLSPFFWIVLTLATFLIVVQIQSHISIEIVRSFFNPLLISAILIIILLLVLDVPYEQYQSGGQEKACRDLLRDNGGAVRYGFHRFGDELGVYNIADEDIVCLWPDVAESAENMDGAGAED